MAHPLDGALAHVARAEEHFGTLDQEIRAWAKEQRTGLSFDKNPEATEFTYFLMFDPVPDVVRWSLLLGDMVHNLRSALDHAAYACSGPTTPKGCEFPIFLDKRYFDLPETDRNGHLYKIRGIKNDSVRALIERAQPWKDPVAPDKQALWVVHQLDIQDKHRLLTPVASVPRVVDLNAKITYFDEGDHVATLTGKGWVPFDKKAEAFTISTGEPASKVDVKIGYQIGVNLLIGENEFAVQGALHKVSNYVRLVVEQIRDAFV